jgi:transposase
MIYAALDVSLRSVAICIVDEAGKLRLERSTSSELPDLIRCLQDFAHPIHQVGLEAGNLSHHISAGLTEAGYDVVCMESRQVAAALSAMRNKMVCPGGRRERRPRRQMPRAGRITCISAGWTYRCVRRRSASSTLKAGS